MVLRSTTNRFRMLALLMLAGATLSACTPAPEPTPTPTAAFASEEEAFAAAEEVYREYNDASNRGGDTTSFLSDSALESDLETKQYLAENDLTLSGQSEIISFTGDKAELQAVARLQAVVCIDVSDSRLLDSQGNDVTPEARDDRWLLRVTFVGADGQLSITNSEVADDESC